MTIYTNNQLIRATDLSYDGVLDDIKKSKTVLQAIFEGFTNALEAIKIKQLDESELKGFITIRIYATETTLQTTEFHSLSITDNGIGFNEEEFTRFNIYKQKTKGFKNLGSGRIQYLHYFDSTTIKSRFEQDGKYFERKFIVSKNDNFIRKNAIVKHEYCEEIAASNSETTLSFNGLLESSKAYNDLNETTLKEKLIERYIHYFCYNKNKLPEIKIEFYVQSKLIAVSEIEQTAIPEIDQSQAIQLHYSKVALDGTTMDQLDKAETFRIDAFKISKQLLKENKINLVSKGEVIEKLYVGLKNLVASDQIDGYRYLFLVSSNYIDEKDTHTRGVLQIPSKDGYKRELFSDDEHIFIEDIQNQVNANISLMYPEIAQIKQHHYQEFLKLKEMFLLDDETAKEIRISVNDSETDILKKFYEAEAKKAASIDASIKESVDNLEKLDTRSPNYTEELETEINKLVKAIPLQNKKTLTHYVARRKLVLDLLDKILERKLQAQQETRNDDEALIHHLLFQKGSVDTATSDLWIINEDFIYFKGGSEKELNQLKINDEKVFKEQFTEEEQRYLMSLGENRTIKRPDVLLFPEEGKCIIIEFKAPQVNVATHLTQLDRYASLIRNYTKDQFQITTFYAYLLGESIEANDVRGFVSAFEEAYQFDYLFRPAIKVVGFDGRKDGSIYTEVIKYSTLLQRAKQRNRIFIEKLR